MWQCASMCFGCQLVGRVSRHCPDTWERIVEKEARQSKELNMDYNQGWARWKINTQKKKGVCDGTGCSRVYQVISVKHPFSRRTSFTINRVKRRWLGVHGRLLFWPRSKRWYSGLHNCAMLLRLSAGKNEGECRCGEIVVSCTYITTRIFKNLGLICRSFKNECSAAISTFCAWIFLELRISSQMKRGKKTALIFALLLHVLAHTVLPSLVSVTESQAFILPQSFDRHCEYVEG